MAVIDNEADQKGAVRLLEVRLRFAAMVCFSWISLSLIMPGAIAASAVEEARSQLTNIDRLPLSIPPETGRLVTSSEQLSPTQMSQPSLTWIREQVGERYGSDRLVVQWRAYQVIAPNTFAYVDVIVDEQIWELLSYFERYAFIAQFGAAAKQYGYHLRVFHTGDVFNNRDAQNTGSSRLVALRGAHICGFEAAPISAPVPIDPGAASDIPCDIVLNEASRRNIL